MPKRIHMSTRSIRKAHSWRGFLWLGNFEFHVEISWRWRHGLIATCGYGGQEDFAECMLAIPRLFLHFAFATPFKWHHIRPFDGKYGERERKVGLYQMGGTLYLLLGHDARGTYYGTHGRFGALGRVWRELRRNQRVALFRGAWILGQPKHSLEVPKMGIPVVVKVGQWDSDEYSGTARHVRRTRKRRFSTRVTDGYEIDMQQGIPFPGKGENSWDCGDDAYFGFGGDTIDGAIAHIAARARHGRRTL